MNFDISLPLNLTIHPFEQTIVEMAFPKCINTSFESKAPHAKSGKLTKSEK